MKIIIDNDRVADEDPNTPYVQVHFKDNDFYNLDITPAHVLYELLVEFKAQDKHASDYDTFLNDLDASIKSFKIIKEKALQKVISNTEYKDLSIKISNGLEAFARIYQRLWN